MHIDRNVLDSCYICPCKEVGFEVSLVGDGPGPEIVGQCELVGQVKVLLRLNLLRWGQDPLHLDTWTVQSKRLFFNVVVIFSLHLLFADWAL